MKNALEILAVTPCPGATVKCVCVTEKRRGPNGKGIPFVACLCGPYVGPAVLSIAYLSGLNQGTAVKPFK